MLEAFDMHINPQPEVGSNYCLLEELFGKNILLGVVLRHNTFYFC